MSCNCNTVNPKCEPCAICTPPGVTDLPQCTPVDPCEGNRINLDCVTYSGIDFSCLNVYNGDQLIDVLLNILNFYFPQEECCVLEGEIEVLPTTTTTTSTTTTTTSTTTTTTTSTTTTTTTAAPEQAYDCCIPFVSTMTGPKLYNTPLNVLTAVSIPGFVTGKTIANSVDKIWSVTNTPGEIKEWNFVQTPFAATLNRTITYSTSYVIASLFARNNTTLIGIDYSVIPSRVVSLDITTTTAVVTVLFSLPTNRIAVANPVYTTTGRLIVLNSISTVVSDTYITQYSNLTGTLEVEIPLLNSQIKSLFSCENSFYLLESSQSRYIIDKTSPYLLFQLINNVSEIPLSSSTAAKCITGHFEVAPTTTTSTTTTTTTTAPIEPRFIVTNSTSSSVILDVVPVFYTRTSVQNFPLNVGQSVTGNHFAYSGGINVIINNSGVSSCLKLYVNNVVVDSEVILTPVSSTYTLICPAVTPGDQVKIILSPGPC